MTTQSDRSALAPGRPASHRSRFPGEESLRSALGRCSPAVLNKTSQEAGTMPATASRRAPPAIPGARLGPVLSLLVFLLFFGFAGGAIACPSCKEALAQDPAGEKLTRGWARSIHLLMVMPYLLFGGVTFVIIRSARRNKEESKP